MEKLLCASMMCADYGSLKDEVAKLEKADIDVYHVDIMDGSYVPNFGMGLQDLEFIRKSTNRLVDVHLMIENPSKYVDFFAEKGADIIYIHPEADTHAARTLDSIRAKGVKSGIALNPGTSVEAIKPLLNIVDYILIMTVNPGFAGQKYLDYVDEKIEELVGLKEKKNYAYELVVDGAISPEKIHKLSLKGVKGFVLGTSALFGKGDYTEIIPELKKL